jgi:DNA-binding LacI/PurR family transcriptional regulator
VTIVDVAEAAGVSKTTASDALRGRGRVSDATVAAVVSAADRLGYTINRSARSLRTATTGAIGLYLPQVLVRSEYYLTFMQGVVAEAAGSDYDVTLIFPGQRVASYAPHVDGIVVCDVREGDPVVTRLLSTRLPVVSCETIPGDDRAAGVVWSDPVELMRRLLDLMVAAGTRVPALLSSTTASDWVRGLITTYDAWCRDTGHTPIVAPGALGMDPAERRRIVDRLLDEHPEIDGLACIGDGVAADVAPSITAHGRDLDRDFRLVSCSERDAFAPLFAAIDTDGPEAGRQCARLLFELLRGEAQPGVQRKMELEIRTRS